MPQFSCAVITAILQMQEYWRYLLTGIPAFILFGLFCRFIGRCITPFGEWVSFSGTCIAAEHTEQGTLLRVQFRDRHRLSHTAALLTAHPAAAMLQKDDTVRIAIRAKRFVAGEYPDTEPEPPTARTVYLAAEHKQILRRALLRECAIGLISCGVAFAVLYAAMQFFFPQI